MAYTPSLRLTLPLTGTLDGTWGDTVNNGITSLTDTAIAGTAAVIQGDVANYTLTSNSGATDEARSMFLNITGALTAARNVVCPTVSKLYFIKNSTTGGFAITLKTTAGTGISIPNGGTIMALYCDGTNVIDAVSYLSTLKIGGLTASQAVFSDASKNLVSNAITGTGNVVMSTSPTLVTPALGTPSVLVGTNITGTATNFTASNVTTNANLTGPVTSVGNATSFTSGMSVPAFTLAGTVSGGGNQINNVIIGASTPLAGNFTTLGATGQLTLNTSVGSNVDFQNGGGVSLGRIFNDAGYLNLQASANVNGLRLEAPAHVFGRVNGATITDTSSTGLAVTGAISATTGITSLNGTVAVQGATGALSIYRRDTNAYAAGFYSASGGVTLDMPGQGSAFVMNSSGNLGLGVTPSAWGTSGSVYKAIQIGVSGAIYGRTSSETVGLASGAYADDVGFKYLLSGNFATLYNQNSGSHIWYTAPSGTAGAAIAFTQAMTLDAGGNLGIGTASPGAKLTVAGNDQSNVRMRLENSGGGGRTWEIIGGVNLANNSDFSIRDVTGGTNTFVIQPAGNIGIGTVSPLTRLNVASSVAGGVSAVRVDNTDTGATSIASIQLATAISGNTWQMFARNNSLNWGVAGVADYMKLDSSGNLGLGVAPSNTAGITTNFEMSNGSTIASRSNNAAVPQLYLLSNGVGTGYAPTYKVDGRAASYQLSGYDGAHYWGIAPSGTAGAAIAFTQAMTLDASGRLLVGTTTSPSSSNIRAVFQGPINGGAQFAAGGGGGAVFSADGAGLSFFSYTGAVGSESYTERMRINSAGNVGIGTASPGAKLDVIGTGIFRGTPADPEGRLSVFGNITAVQGAFSLKAVSTRSLVFVDDYAGTERLRIDSTGNVGVGTASPTSKLTVQQSASAQGVEVIANTGGFAEIQIVSDRTSGNLGGFSASRSGDAEPFFQLMPLADRSAVNFAMGDGAATATSKMTLTSAGNVGIGTSDTTDSKLKIEYASNTIAGFKLINTATSTTSGGAIIGIVNDDGAANAAGDRLGVVTFSGALNTTGTTAAVASVEAFADGTFSATSAASSLRFGTTAAGSITRAERMRIDSAGNVLVGLTTATSNGANLQTSDGITFPATQVASANANTLDDYEEGTFTPTIIGTTTAGVGTYTRQVGRYTKIGNRIFFSISVITAAHTGTGSMKFSGLPFVSSSVTGNVTSLATLAEGVISPASTIVTSIQDMGTSQISFYSIAIATGVIAALAIDPTSAIYVSGHYEAA